MTKRLTVIAILTLVLTAIVIAPAFAANRKVNKMDDYRFLYRKQMEMVGKDEGAPVRGFSSPVSLGVTAGNSPGQEVGITHYDYQQNSTMGRLVDWRGGPFILFAWTFGPTVDVEGSRTGGFNVWDGNNGNFPLGVGLGCPVVNPTERRAGFVNLDVRPPTPATDEEPAAVYGMHTAPGVIQTDVRTEVFWEYATTSFGRCDWSTYASMRVNDSLNNLYSTDQVIWPKMEYHINGTDTVTYACSYGGGGVDAIVLFRTEGQHGSGTWEAVYIDTCFFIVQDITASRSTQKVAIAYTIPTATQTQGASERDVAYRESTDMGQTFGPVINVTNYNDAVNGYRAWLEVSCLYDTDDNLHIIWNASVYTPAGGAGSRACRLFHWADHTGTISTVHNADWDPTLADCAMDVNTLNVAKFNISQCDTNLYVIWSQANDPPNGITDDCGNSDIFAANLGGNADIYLSVSGGLNGLSWDAARNLTNTYSPNCDTIPGNQCDSDNWGSMSRYGMNNADWGSPTFDPVALTVDPSGSYSGTYYLDIQYINDLAPGGGTENTDIVPRNSVKWFRLPCVDPVVQSNINLSPSTIAYPYYVQHGEQAVVPVTLENSGNTGATGTITAVELTGPLGWLAVDLGSFNIPAALNNFDTMNVTLNVGGVVNNPGTIQLVTGAIVLDVDAPTVKDSVSVDIDLLVADTIVGVIFDTVATSCLSLAVASNGNMGNAGIGDANMNFPADCDTGAGIPGDETVYLYDASPIIFTGDTLASWSIFGDGFASANGFKPVSAAPAAPGSFSGANYDAFWSGPMVTIDSSVTIEKTWYAPTAIDSCNFIIQTMCLYATDGTAQTGITVGEAWDWDVPSDTAVNNSAGSDPFEQVVWLRGGEWDDGGAGDSLECQQNDARFGGAGLIGIEDVAGSTFHPDTAAENFFTALNEDFVLPAGGFIPAELYENMQTNTGITVVPSSTIEDQHMVMTVFKNYDLAAGDTLVVHIAMATVENGAQADMIAAVNDARAWFADNPNLPKRPPAEGCCVGETGDVNGSGGSPTLTDLTILVNRLFVTFDWGATACPASANTNGDAACALTLTDLTLLVNKLFVTFEATAQCTDFDQSNCEPAVGLK